MKTSFQPRIHRHALLLGLLLIGATVLAYQPAWQAGFIWDDDVYVTNNKLLTAPDGLRRIWFSFDSPSQYFPMVYTVLRAEHAVWGLTPGGYHCFNILLHAINAVLLWRLLKRLKIPAPWFAAALFALHPVEVESVAWVTELKNTLSLFFCLLAAWHWLNFAEERPGRWRFYGWALLFQALALFSKTTACTLPAALLLVLWWQHKRIGWRRIAHVIPFVVMGALMGLVTMWWERYHQFAVGEEFHISAMGRFLVACHAIWFYLGKLVWPVDLSFSYWRWQVQPPDLEAYGWVALTIASATAIFALRRRTGRGLETAALYYVATLLPMLGLIMEYTFRYSFVADHYQYAASIGPLALAAGAIDRGLRKWEEQKIICGLILLVLGILTWRQCRIYRDSETLWQATLERSPKSFIARNNLAQLLEGNGEFDRALELCRQSLQIETNNPSAELNLGYALLHKGDIAGAIEHCERSLAEHPGEADGYYDLGLAGLQQKNFPAAETNFRAAIKYKPEFAEAWCNLGYALLQEGKINEAIPDYKEALDLTPQYPLAHNDLGSIYLRQHDVADAMREFQIASDQDPSFIEPRFNLASGYFTMGKLDDARNELEAVAELRPDLSQAHVALGKLAEAYAKAGRLQDAAQTARRALELARASHEDALTAALSSQLEHYTRGGH